jgi:hypothetical protein
LRAGLENLAQTVQGRDEAARYKLAAHYFEDARDRRPFRTEFYGKRRCVAHLVEINRLWPRRIFIWQYSTIWHTILSLLSLIYMGLSFWEPANSIDYAAQSQEFDLEFRLPIEIIVLAGFLIDLVLEAIHLFYDSRRGFMAKYLLNIKFSSRVAVDLALTTDMIIYYSLYPSLALRFARILRASKLHF